LQEIEEKHKLLLLRQEETKRQQQLVYRNRLSECKDRISAIVTECSHNQQDEELTHCRTNLLNLCQDIEVLLVSKSEFSDTDLQCGERKGSEAEQIRTRYQERLQQQHLDVLAQVEEIGTAVGQLFVLLVVRAFGDYGADSVLAFGQ